MSDGSVPARAPTPIAAPNAEGGRGRLVDEEPAPTSARGGEQDDARPPTAS